MTPVSHPPKEALIQRVRGEYLEMPGLRLTVLQAERLWALDEPTCESVLDSLVDAGFLTHARNGSYVRAASY
jgi:hypothetical protein